MTKYELNLFGRELNKDLTNLMELLRKQDGDNKAILYAGRHIQKIVLPVEEFQKMCQRLESIDNANPNEALGDLAYICRILGQKAVDIKWLFKNEYNTIEQALIKAQEQKKVLEILKEKNVDILDIRMSKTVDDYNFAISSSNLNREDLTQEEFNTIKEVLECIK